MLSSWITLQRVGRPQFCTSGMVTYLLYRVLLHHLQRVMVSCIKDMCTMKEACLAAAAALPAAVAAVR
jgi:hypothetical protein